MNFAKFRTRPGSAIRTPFYSSSSGTSPLASPPPLFRNPSCSSCQKECRPENAVATCKQCMEGKNQEIENLKSSVSTLKERNDELKVKVKELESKVKFLGWSSPVDHRSMDLEDDRYSCYYAPDVVLVASDDGINVVSAHKAILINKSPVFKAMLRNETEESQTSTIKISEVSYHDLCAFVNYLYTADVNLVDDQRAQDLLAMGEKYQVKHLKAYCENFLTSKVNASNALKYLTFATKYKAEDLVESSLNVIIENMNKLKLQDEYEELVKKDPHLVIRIYESYREKKLS